jgi:hypothetical protein
MPPLGFLLDGLLPMFILPYSVSGVACQQTSQGKYLATCSVKTNGFKDHYNLDSGCMDFTNLGAKFTLLSSQLVAQFCFPIYTFLI